MESGNTIIQDLLKDKDISLIGFADLSEIDPEVRFGLRYGICLAVALKVFPNVEGAPTYEYFEEYKKVSMQLREVSFYLEEKLREMGYNAYSLAREHQDAQYVTPLPFKTLATRAGLGWIGKSTALVTREYGSAVRLNGVLTDLPLETAEPVNGSFCGDCRECVEHCPAGAITGNNWTLNVPRQELLDPFACKAKVVERGKFFGITEGSCGICIGVCPWSIKYRERLKK